MTSSWCLWFALKVMIEFLELKTIIASVYFAGKFIVINSKLEDFLKNNIAGKLVFILQQLSLLGVWLNSHFHLLGIS